MHNENYIENIYNDDPVVKKAFEIICGNKIISDGYYDLRKYIGNEIALINNTTSDIINSSCRLKSNIVDACLSDNPLRYILDIMSRDSNIKLNQLISSAIIACLFYSYNNDIEGAKTYIRNMMTYSKNRSYISCDAQIKDTILYNSYTRKVIIIDGYNQLECLMQDLSSRNDNHYYFRGHGDVNYVLVPSIMRTNQVKHYEQHLSDRIKHNHVYSIRTQFQRLALMQHYGLPTRLLDVTKDWRVAAFMACYNSLDNNGELIVFSPPSNAILTPFSTIVKTLSYLSELSDNEQKILANQAALCRDKNIFAKRKIAGKLREAVSLEYNEMNDDFIDPDDLLNCFFVDNVNIQNCRIQQQDAAFIICGLRRDGDGDEYLNRYRYRGDEHKKLVIIINKRAKSEILYRLEQADDPISYTSLFGTDIHGL